MIDSRECGLLVRWAIHHYGGITPALDMAERVAIWLLASEEAIRSRGETTADHLPFFEKYFHEATNMRHGGDCPLAPAWFVAPITCDACVYETYMVKAFEMLRVENGGVLDHD